jgi:uncharacterized membrane protein
MQSGRDKTNPSLFWVFGLIAITAAITAAFWLLLGWRYSPETYDVMPMIRDTMEFVWCGLSLATAVVCVGWLLRQRAMWRPILWSSVPLAVVSIFIIIRAAFGVSFRCYDMILFCTVFGWTIVPWSKWAMRTTTGGTSRAIMAAKLLGAGVWTSVLLLGVFYFWQQVRYWNNLALGYANCGEHASLFYNTICNPHELFLSVNPVKPMFWDHFYPGIVVLTPLWLLWPGLKMIIALQIICIVGVSLPLYWIGRQVFQERTAALLLVVAWLIYPSTSQFIYDASYGFHLGNICLPLYFVALACWLGGRPRWAMAVAIWAMLIKEEAAIVVGMFGLYLALFERRRSSGIALTVFAFGFFLLVTTLVIPSMKLGEYVQLRFFSDLGNTTWEIFLSPITRPRAFWGRLFEARSFYFAVTLLAPLLFYPLRRPAILFVASLTFMFDCLNPTLKSICYHYQAALLPVLFWALASSLQHTETKTRRTVLLGVIASGALLSLFFGNTFWSKDTLTINLWPGRLGLVRRFGAQIDSHGSLFATQRVAAHFITQHHLYTDLPVPEEIDYALLDLRDSWRGAVSNLNWLQYLRGIQREVETNPHLHLVAAEDGLLLYSRQGVPLDPHKLVECDSLPDTARVMNENMGYGIRLVGVTVSPMPRIARENLEAVRVTAYSTLATPTDIDLAMRCFVNAGEDAKHLETYASDFQPLGQCVWPPARWVTNNLYADDFIIVLPLGVAKQVSGVAFKVRAIGTEAAE